jgi:hypothetical protein
MTIVAKTGLLMLTRVIHIFVRSPGYANVAGPMRDRNGHGARDRDRRAPVMAATHRCTFLSLAGITSARIVGEVSQELRHRPQRRMHVNRRRQTRCSS